MYTQFLSGLDFYVGPSIEILLTGNAEGKIIQYLKILRDAFIPNKVVLYKKDGTEDSLSKVAGFTEAYSLIDGNAAVYVCENFSCKLPVTSEKDLRDILSTQ